MSCTLYIRHKTIVKGMREKKYCASIPFHTHYCLYTAFRRPQACRVQTAWPGICGLTCSPVPTLPVTYPICPWHNPGPSRLVCSLSPANTFCVPPPCLGSHQVPCFKSRKLVQRSISRSTVPMKPSPALLSGMFSATCLAHTTARHFCVIVYDAVGLFSTAAHKPLEGREHVIY